MATKSDYKLSSLYRLKFFRGDYSDDLRKAVDYYKSKHCNNHKLLSFKLIVWCFRSLFRKYSSDRKITEKETITHIKKEEVLDINSRRINVGFLFGGGYGDVLIAANYLFKFKEKFDDVDVDVFVHDVNGLVGNANTIFYDGHIIRRLYPMKGYEHIFKEYDLFIRCNRVPNAIHVKINRLVEFEPELLDFYYEIEKYKKLNERYYTKAGITDGQSALLCILNERKRIQQPDVGGMLGITEKYEYPVLLKKDENNYLNEVGLYSCKYITVHRGLDTKFGKKSTKLWPVEYYEILIKKIKKEYPNIKIVEIGASHDRCPEFKGVDINLVEKTSMEEVKVLLKNALIHIDGEGGMVHLRHALSGAVSIVLFGPTDYRFYGYKENINIRGAGCAVSCEWAIRGWNVECLRGNRVPPCMGSIIPETVFEKFKNVMGLLEK